MVRFKVGDKVKLVQIQNPVVGQEEHLHKVGVILDVDENWSFPYEVDFDSEHLYCDSELEPFYESNTHTYLNHKIENNFKYHKPKSEQLDKYEAIREKAKELAYIIDTLCPDSREKSVAMTELESAVMWANASVARN